MKKPTISKLKKQTQTVFNKYIRERDSSNGYFTCISCNLTLPVKSMNAGHYFNTKHYNHLRFDEENCFGECQRCNGFNEAHLIGYTLNLKKKLGDEKYFELLKRATIKLPEFTREELEAIKQKYAK